MKKKEGKIRIKQNEEIKRNWREERGERKNMKKQFKEHQKTRKWNLIRVLWKGSRKRKE